MGSFTLVLLSDHPELKQQCCELLSEEWKRSETARLHGLSGNSKSLPDSVLLLEETETVAKVIGHSRLSRVLEDTSGCWIASVIVTEHKRGQGLGKLLMKKTEDYARILGFTTAYLNTIDKQGFYEHLGYTYCSPVSPCKGSFLVHGNTCKHNVYCLITGVSQDEEKSQLKSQLEQSATKTDTSSDSVVSCAPLPPPPPPELPPINKNHIASNCSRTPTGHYWMKKYL